MPAPQLLIDIMEERMRSREQMLPLHTLTCTPEEKRELAAYLEIDVSDTGDFIINGVDVQVVVG